MPIVFLAAAVCFLECSIFAHEMPTGWYCAGSNVKDDDAGGFGPCNNLPKKCGKDFPDMEGKLALVAYPDEIIKLRRFDAMPLRLINRTGKTVGFSACDSSLFIVQEALIAGQWQALETFPETFCGNSFHRVFLEPDEYWEFFAPRRVGWHNTRLRFRLEPGGELGIANGAAPLFSNEFVGFIEP